MTEQELKDPGWLYLMAAARGIFGAKYIQEQLPKPCYKKVAAEILKEYQSEKDWRIVWLLVSIMEACVIFAMAMIGG